ncbi:MAG: bifunctional UDP-N-acetylglucosamine diphosphorylase/glucosamine-1-phosphate N-acetyltransferase GlmU [Gammaproteobacteria bacterium]|nr:bifunctional UDP-N-acetylglucosamine diphosphorylase/glucosamine-1-phosphate N-acetyltransferase GlmU [Gammaproteobacteria bacterium]
MKIEFIVLAAGQGKRTKTSLPKVLLPLGGEPMLFSVLRNLVGFKNAQISLVVGKGAKQVKDATNLLVKSDKKFGGGASDTSGKSGSKSSSKIRYVEQKEQLGTGHAVAAAIKGMGNDGIAVVLYGDVPLLKQATIKRIVEATVGSKKIDAVKSSTALKDEPGSAVWLAATLPNPTGYGRIVRSPLGNPIGIVEEKDCDAGQKDIREINTGILAAPVKSMKRWLKTLMSNEPRNIQGEYLLTDLMKMACEEDHEIKILQARDVSEIQGANDMWQLAQVERVLQLRRVKDLAQQGVRFQDPARVDILGDVGDIKVKSGVQLGVNVVLKGKVKLGANVVIGNHCILEDTSIGADSSVHDFCHIIDSKIGARCSVGPYARLRPASILGDAVHIGNFVETKNSTIGSGAKASHLSYLGDAVVGSDANVGAGVITCNYDGKSKHQTIIGGGSFIGSNSSLVAPVKVGKDAVVGAGSVISKNVANNSLALTRSPQRAIEKYSKPVAKSSDKFSAKSVAKPSDKSSVKSTAKLGAKPVAKRSDKSSAKFSLKLALKSATKKGVAKKGAAKKGAAKKGAAKKAKR